MARKQIRYTVVSDDRDKGKLFIITEMTSRQGEEWAARALFTMLNCGVDVPDELLSAGLAGLSALGIKSLTKVPFDLAKPLFDEMFQSIEIQPDPRQPAVVRPLIDDDIEEIATRLKLRKAWLDLHLSFFMNAARSTPSPEAAATSPA